jgi:acyl-coenzyme A thioesterase PaaI-like protein
MVTVNLSSDFLAPARLGDWIEAHVTVQKRGARLAFASCHLTVADKCILRASGVFAVVGQAGAPAQGRFDG